MHVGTLYTRMATATVDDDLSNDSEVSKVDDMVKSTYNRMHYQSATMIKITWDGVAQFGGADSEVTFPLSYVNLLAFTFILMSDTHVIA